MATQGRVHPMENPPSFSFPKPENKSDSGSDDQDRDTAPFLSRMNVPNGTYIIQIPKEQILRTPPPENVHRAKVYARRPIRRRMMRRCCCSMIASLLCLIIAFGATAGILYLIVRPKAPSYSLKSVNMTGIDPVLTSASVTLSPVIEATIEADNMKNKRLSVLYQSGGTVDLYFEDTKLCSGAWPKFRQGPKNITEVGLQMTGSGLLLTADTRDALVSNQKNKSVSFTVHAKVPVKVKYGPLTTWKITAKVKCDITVDGISGEMSVLKKDCSAKTNYLW
jgi:hypothetical protein